MAIDKLRSEIDRLDTEIVGLLNERAKQALLVGEEKKKDGVSIYDEAREQLVMELVRRVNCGPLNDESIMKIYHQIIRSCSDLQRMSD